MEICKKTFNIRPPQICIKKNFCYLCKSLRSSRSRHRRKLLLASEQGSSQPRAAVTAASFCMHRSKDPPSLAQPSPPQASACIGAILPASRSRFRRKLLHASEQGFSQPREAVSAASLCLHQSKYKPICHSQESTHTPASVVPAMTIDQDAYTI